MNKPFVYPFRLRLTFALAYVTLLILFASINHWILGLLKWSSLVPVYLLFSVFSVGIAFWLTRSNLWGGYLTIRLHGLFLFCCFLPFLSAQEVGLHGFQAVLVMLVIWVLSLCVQIFLRRVAEKEFDHLWPEHRAAKERLKRQRRVRSK